MSYAAPTAKAGALTDVSYDQNTGAKTVAAAAAFTGAGLSFSVTGAGASIDAATGVVTLSTTTLVSAVAVTVTASNSGGSATSSFKVTVNAVVPPALVTAPALSGTGKIGTAVSVSAGSWSGNPAPTTSLQWRANGAAIAGATAASYTPVAADDGKD